LSSEDEEVNAGDAEIKQKIDEHGDEKEDESDSSV